VTRGGASGAIVVLGGSGLLGRALSRALAAAGRSHLAPARSELDLGRLGSIEARLEALAPGAIVNASGFTDVAAAEREERRDEVYLLNRDAPEALARAARSLSVPFVHVSTDYVFDGARGRPYEEDDPPNPLQTYGASKLEGENRVLAANPGALVVRTSTLYGHTDRPRPTYVDAILAQARRERVLSVVELPVASPTYASDLAGLILALLAAGASGIVHAVNDGRCSRLELSRAIVAEAGRADEVEVRTKPAPADGLARPADSSLSVSRLASLLGRRPRPWREALREYLRERGEAFTS
jgi:dTDP-4-dehydrorhamnose reductase